jgi:hypothetical protein
MVLEIAILNVINGKEAELDRHLMKQRNKLAKCIEAKTNTFYL